MDNRPIGVFDSGLGGLTAVKELKKILPQESILYFGDTGRVPYGSKSRETILKYAAQDMNFLLTHNVKAVVAACGTVSSVAKEIGEKIDVPYIDVLSPTSYAAVQATQNKKIGVIGTCTTIGSGSFVRTIQKFDRDVEIFTQACPLFVPLVENGFVSPGDPITILTAERYLKHIKEQDVDTLILGCTHFPIISPAISSVMGDKVTLIDSGRETARYLAKVLAEQDLLSEPTHKPVYRYSVSDTVEGFQSIAELFLGCSTDGEVTRIDIDRY